MVASTIPCIQSPFVANSESWQNQFFFMNYTCIWMIHFLFEVTYSLFQHISKWFHTSFDILNVSYMMTESLGLLSVYSVEVNCFRDLKHKKKCIFLESLQPPHQNHTSSFHENEYIKLQRQLSLLQPPQTMQCIWS